MTIKCNNCENEVSHYAIKNEKITVEEHPVANVSLPYLRYDANYFCENCGKINIVKRSFILDPEKIARTIETDMLWERNSHIIKEKTNE